MNRDLEMLERRGFHPVLVSPPRGQAMQELVSTIADSLAYRQRMQFRMFLIALALMGATCFMAGKMFFEKPDLNRPEAISDPESNRPQPRPVNRKPRRYDERGQWDRPNPPLSAQELIPYDKAARPRQDDGIYTGVDDGRR